MYTQQYLFIALVAFIAISNCDAETTSSLRGRQQGSNEDITSNEKKNVEGILTSAGNFVSRHLIRATALSTDILYRRSLARRPVRAGKIKGMLTRAENCMYGRQGRNRIGDCFSNVLVDENVLDDSGFLSRTFMSGGSTEALKGMLEFEARPREEMTPAMKRDFIEEEKADEVAATLGLLAEDSENQGEFKRKTMSFLRQERDALHLGPEALDGISIFMDVADFGDE